MTSPFKERAKELYQSGYSVIPLHANDKRPFEKEWSKFCLDKMAVADVKSYISRDSVFNLGVTLGPASGIVALDFDDDVNEYHDKIKKMVPESPVIKVGAKGCTAFYRYNGEKNRSWKYKKDGVKYTVVELLSEGRQTVVPPSIHPDGGAYHYSTIEGLEDVKAEDLPLLPEDFNRRVDKLIGLAEEDNRPSVEASLDDIRDALRHIDAGDYEDWVRCGMAIKGSYPDDGLEVWDEWSQTSDKYKPDEIVSKWTSFKGGDISVGTLVYLALQGGWEPSFSSDEMRNDVMRYFISMDQVEDELDILREGGRYNGTPCGLPLMDNHLNFRKGELTVVSGYGGAGKSEILDSILYGLMTSRDDWRFAAVSMEKSQTKHYDDLVHKHTKCIRQDRGVGAFREAKKFLRDHMIMLDYSSVGRDLNQMLVQVKRYMNFGKIDGLVVDPFNLIKRQSGSTILDHSSDVVTTLSSFAKENDIHVFIVAHPTKPNVTFGELPKITMYSIAGGADWVNVAHNIILVTRNDDESTTVEIGKVRDQEVDSPGEFVLQFDKYTRDYSEGKKTRVDKGEY